MPNPAQLPNRATAGQAPYAGSDVSGAPSTTVQYYENIAEKQEKSPVPWLIKLCRAIVWIFYAVVVLNTILLGLTFLLELFGANPEAGFVDWIYRSTERAMQPFHDIFPTVEFSERSVLDVSVLFAIVIYLILVVALQTLLNWLQRKLIEQQTKMAQARATANAVALDEESRIAAAQAYGRQQAAWQSAARQDAARQEAARQEAARQTAAAQAAAAAAAASQAAAQSAAQSAAHFAAQPMAAGYQQPAPEGVPPTGTTPGAPQSYPSDPTYPRPPSGV
jgi:hypothetical protein